MFATRLAAILGCALASALPAQTTDARVLGLGFTGPTIRTQDSTSCAEQECDPVFPAIAGPCAGGCAYDSRTRGTWITNGPLIGKFDARDPNCTVQCPLQALPTSGPGAVATGLAFDHTNNRLLVTDTNDVLTILQISQCSLTIVSQCLVPLPDGLNLTGVAFDRVQNRVFYSIADCENAAAGGIIGVASYANPCTLLCASLLIDCPDGGVLGPIVGLAYDACTDRLKASDGTRVVTAALDTSTCITTSLSCCPTIEPLVGLSIEPFEEVEVGTSCSSAPCANCAPVHAFESGDPIIGNTSFTLDAFGMPANSQCVFLLNVGPCSPPGFVFPPFCAPILVPPAGMLSFSLPTGGSAGCTGAASLAVTLPLNLANCGITMSSQVAGACQPGGGTFVTNCLTWTVGA